MSADTICSGMKFGISLTNCESRVFYHREILKSPPVSSIICIPLLHQLRDLHRILRNLKPQCKTLDSTRYEHCQSVTTMQKLNSKDG
ncbi:hypothetical protein OESDEN_17290, partial [Oesophagostomum dentatum]